MASTFIFLWTIYQMTKYTSIIKTFYELVVFPLFEYISQPLLKKWYYVLNLMRFNVVVQLWSSLWVRRKTPSSITNALKKGAQAERSISTT